ncbi:helix-turn-helix transcriptional regulator [Peptococcaceae bacterium 1198_IL3148]
MSNNYFGEYLAQLRIEAGYYDRKSLAIESGISNSTLTRIENGVTKKPAPATLDKLASCLDVPVEQLMKVVGYL